MWAGKGTGGASMSSKDSERGREKEEGGLMRCLCILCYGWKYFKTLNTIFVLLWADRVSDWRLSGLNSRYLDPTDLGSGSLRSGSSIAQAWNLLDHRRPISFCISYARMRGRFLWDSGCWVLIQFLKMLLLWPSHLIRDLLPNTITMGWGIKLMALREYKHWVLITLPS